MLTVYVDFKSLPSYLAVKPALELASRYGVSIDWRPFLAWERDVPQETHDARLSKRHHDVRLASQRATDSMYAALQGIDLSYPEVASASDLALGSLALIDGDTTAFVQAAFNAYWYVQADLNSEAVVSDLLSATGFAGDFSEASARAGLMVAQSAAEDSGVVDAPCFVIASQCFVGRQHLPWIEEYLAAEQTTRS